MFSHTHDKSSFSAVENQAFRRQNFRSKCVEFEVVCLRFGQGQKLSPSPSTCTAIDDQVDGWMCGIWRLYVFFVMLPFVCIHKKEAGLFSPRNSHNGDGRGRCTRDAREAQALGSVPLSAGTGNPRGGVPGGLGIEDWTVEETEAP